MKNEISSSCPTKAFGVLKFYCYAPVKDVEAVRLQNHQYCLSRNLLGRIKVATEGINGTVSGKMQDCIAYRDYLFSDPQFTSHIFFYLTSTDTIVHAKLQVKIKPEIVNSGLHHIQPSQSKAERCYITPEEYQSMRKDRNVVLIDVRSNYEHQLGKFDEAITFDVASLREVPEKLKKIEWDRTKKYVVLCTGGIKSEKIRDFLKQEMQLPQVYHFCGGVLDYAKKTNGEGFQGSCYVFDHRITSPVSTKSGAISSCFVCRARTDRMVNCANPHCNIHTTICLSCSEKMKGGCSTECSLHPDKRPYSAKGYYLKAKNGYNPYHALQQNRKPN